MPIIAGELTRSIKRCYPPGRHQDKSPLPSELSMLIFFLQTRPTKIHKAGIILEMRARTYATKDNIGNLLVTVEILHEMVRKLNTHLNLFAVQALSVINIVAEKSFGPDTTFIEEASNLFQDFNKYHDGVLFSGHSSYSQEFLATTAKFTKVAKAKEPHSTVFALEALYSLGSSPALVTRTGQQALQIAMHGLEANLPTSDPEVFDEERDHQHTHTSTQHDTSRKAVCGVRAFVDTNSLEQITRIIISVLEWLGKSEGEWQQKLMVNLAKWVPPQNRFIVTKTLVSEMVKLPIQEVKQQRIYTTYLNALLRSDDSKIGLSAVDIQRQIVSLQHRLITRTPESVDNQSIQDLIVRLRSNIGSLSAINIYPGQVADMVGDIITKYAAPVPNSASIRLAANPDSTPRNGSSSSNSGSERPVGIILNDLYDLREILSCASNQQRLSMDYWVNTQWLLASQVPQVLTFYTLTFTDYVKFATKVESPASKRGSLIFRQLCQMLLDHETPQQPANYIAIYYCIAAFVDRLDGEAYCLLPWIYKLLPDESSFEDPKNNDSNVSLMSVALASMLGIARSTSNEKASARLLEMITARVKENVWLPGIIYPTTVPVERSIGIAAKSALPHFERAQYSVIDLANIGLSSEEEAESILNPEFEMDEPLNQDDFRIVKHKAMSISGMSNSSGSRNFSGKSFGSIDQGQAPRVADLRRRQTDTQSLHTIGLKTEVTTPSANHKALPVRKPTSLAHSSEATNSPRNGSAKPPSSADLLSMLESVGIDETTTKGRLTV